MIIKTKIKFLFVLSWIAWSCNTLTNADKLSMIPEESNALKSIENMVEGIKPSYILNESNNDNYSSKSILERCLKDPKLCKAYPFSHILNNAIRSGSLEEVQSVINQGADPNFIYESNQALVHGNGLMLAEVHNRADIAMYFIKNNLIKDLNQKDNRHGRTASMRIAYSDYSGWSTVLSALLQKGASIIENDSDKRNILKHLLERYRYIYDHKRDYGDDFVYLHNDKKEMLQQLCAHKDISVIINYQGIQDEVIDLLKKIDKIDKAEAAEIYNILMDSGLII